MTSAKYSAKCWVMVIPLALATFFQWEINSKVFSNPIKTLTYILCRTRLHAIKLSLINHKKSVKRHYGCGNSLQVCRELQRRFVNWRSSSVTPPTLLTVVMLLKGKSQWTLRKKKWSGGGGVTPFSTNSETIRLFNVSILVQIRNTTAWVGETMLQADHRDENGWKAGDMESGSCKDLRSL